jgi:hypothetical protein
VWFLRKSFRTLLWLADWNNSRRNYMYDNFMYATYYIKPGTRGHEKPCHILDTQTSSRIPYPKNNVCKITGKRWCWTFCSCLLYRSVTTVSKFGLKTSPTWLPFRQNSGAHYIEDWVGPKAGLDDKEKRTILFLCQKSNLDCPVVHSVALVTIVTELHMTSGALYTSAVRNRDQSSLDETTERSVHL